MVYTHCKRKGLFKNVYVYVLYILCNFSVHFQFIIIKNRFFQTHFVKYQTIET